MVHAAPLMTSTTDLGLPHVRSRERYATPSTLITGDWDVFLFLNGRGWRLSLSGQVTVRGSPRPVVPQYQFAKQACGNKHSSGQGRGRILRLVRQTMLTGVVLKHSNTHWHSSWGLLTSCFRRQAKRKKSLWHTRSKIQPRSHINFKHCGLVLPLPLLVVHTSTGNMFSHL